MDEEQRVPDSDSGCRRLLLRPEEVAEVLAVSRTRVYELLASRALESVTIGHTRRVPVDAVMTFVERLRGDAADEETP